MLIVENDLAFAAVLLDTARERGFKGIVATSGEAALELADRYRPDAITLDIELPDLDGWTVLDRLKRHPGTRHIPVQVISVTEEAVRSLRAGALGHLAKPVSAEALSETFVGIRQFLRRSVKNLLVIEDNELQRGAIVELVGTGADVATTAVGSGAEALAAISSQPFDCVVVDLGLSDMDGIELIERIRQDGPGGRLPIVVYTGRELTETEESRLTRVAERVILKDESSVDQLVADTSMFLHRLHPATADLQPMVGSGRGRFDPALVGRLALIVDDDVRNIFALTSMLEQVGMRVVYAENGREGIEVLQSTGGVDVVIMDVMMPEMDGFEAMRRIRRIDEFEHLPILALTAKAMHGDRDKCLEAGASDYITKPVDAEQFVSLLRAWLAH